MAVNNSHLYLSSLTSLLHDLPSIPVEPMLSFRTKYLGESSIYTRLCLIGKAGPNDRSLLFMKDTRKAMSYFSFSFEETTSNGANTLHIVLIRQGSELKENGPSHLPVSCELSRTICQQKLKYFLKKSKWCLEKSRFFVIPHPDNQIKRREKCIDLVELVSTVTSPI